MKSLHRLFRITLVVGGLFLVLHASAQTAARPRAAAPVERNPVATSPATESSSVLHQSLRACSAEADRLVHRLHTDREFAETLRTVALAGDSSRTQNFLHQSGFLLSSCDVLDGQDGAAAERLVIIITITHNKVTITIKL